ncbi:MAG: hypothetical protein MUC96_05400 [Myxococcaceae bacterium]|jgi:hypothetical protein|nr:hypothetical protein [Myxococcaceae bacterium]
MEWQYSGVGLKALVEVLRARPDVEQVFARVSPATREALERPSLSKWHDGAVIFDVTLAMDAVMGGDAIEAVYYEHVRRSIGPLMAPFVKVALSLAGNDPRTIFKRMDGMMGSVVKGVASAWSETTPTAGVLTLTHRDEVKVPSVRAWAGVLRYPFDLCEVKGTVRPRLDGFDGHHLVYDLAWTR